MTPAHLRRGAAVLVALIALGGSLAACKTLPGVSPAAATTTAPMPAPHTCHMGSARGEPLPDSKCTPGSTNPDVTPDTIKGTICWANWASSVRPSSSLMARMKRASMASYDFTGTSEYDHLISIELGGALADPANLWPEPGTVPNDKDQVEDALHAAVCAGKVPLRAAQQAIASDWVTALSDLHLPPVRLKGVRTSR